ncbi:conserved hypothetical integral membrane protein [Fodinibius roseus]|uniref:Conserved hypothetical integral membrane protein n=1 Tax=Fodinibius roseus TaxID=1194090 RepID=A0A1M5LWE4_9BACT|nr:putative sulfate exporter family transporter [Fodinibius roseus]SHG69326.1 conserved hypothetical integral membrane protein [Fodinibius roseus]
MDLTAVYKKGLFIILSLFCLTHWVGPPLALLLGIVLAVTIGNTFEKKSIDNMASWLLKASVVGLGFGMNFNDAVEVGKDGLVFTIIFIVSTLGLGYFLAKKLSIDSKTSTLISSGTAICGGSAIAAIAPVIDANNRQISAALGTVFILNSVALFIFPFVGDLLHLSQTQFGYWAAFAIHDTSSVVGAAASYGSTALSVATSVKLGRALWILPLTFVASLVYKVKSNKISIPYFIFLFVGATLLNTFVPSISEITVWIVPLAKQGLTFTLFLIGSGLTIKVVKRVGFRPLIKATILWICITIGSLWVIIMFR